MSALYSTPKNKSYYIMFLLVTGSMYIDYTILKHSNKETSQLLHDLEILPVLKPFCFPWLIFIYPCCRYQDGMPFSTKDRDNDRNPTNCASRCRAGWWYNGCYIVFLTGPHSETKLKSRTYNEKLGIHWLTVASVGTWDSLKTVEMTLH